jgi:DNA mismatch repair ATPase MutL
VKLTPQCIDAYRVAGFVSRPARGTGRNTGDRQFLYINSRPVDHSKIVKVRVMRCVRVRVRRITCN